MLVVLHPDKLTGQPFFNDLVTYLMTHDDVSLRDIKRVFSHVSSLERQIENYVQEGYIRRQDKRYMLGFSWSDNLADIRLDQQAFVDSDRLSLDDLRSLRFSTRLTNQTNQVVIVEKTDVFREALTLSNYFTRLKEQREPSLQQRNLYQLLGDVNSEYALKYMTTFLLKFIRKDQVLQKRPDIFVEALVELGYIRRVSENTYELAMIVDKEQLIFTGF